MNKFKISSKTLILLIGLVIIGVVAIWILSRWGGTEATNLTDLFTTSSETGGELKALETQKLPDQSMFDNGLEDDGRFRQLQDWRTEEIRIGETGRDNPFSQP